MSAQTEPRGGLTYGWPVGYTPWKDEMDANIARLSRLSVPNLYVIDRDLTAPPGDPDPGDAYIPASTATGPWEDHEGDVAVWDDVAEQWVFYQPAVGWLCVVVDEEVLSMYKPAGWSAGTAL